MKDEIPYVLVDSEYVPDPSALARRYPQAGKFDYDDIPVSLRATEGRVRRSNGARNPSWLKKHLTWRGCEAASRLGEVWIRCPYKKLDGSRYCASHKTRAADLPEQ
jgi:hypothetical protein